MAQAFNLTAQLNLQAPGNVNQVISQIRRQLKPIGVQVNIQNTRSIAQANSSLQQLNKNAQASTKSMNQMNRTLQESARRFSVITLATGSFLALANSFKKSVKEAVAFETELLKISQVTGKTVGQLGSLSKEVTRLSTSLGTSSSSLLNVARTLTQAGFAAEDVRKSLNILAQTTLAATFDNIQDTTEGAIALLRQFSNEARAAGGDVKFLEQSLDAVNAVSKRFAVESSDLITVIRRTGGVFSAAGGELNELLALFTSVRSTTRESAETIATGLRTIFTRIQRPESIEQLREFGIELQDAQGRFVGAFEAFRRLSVGLRSIDPKTTAFSQIVEDLGGFRQVGKVIPLIQQFTTAQSALNVAQGSAGSVARDALVAQQGLGNQISKTREQFDALIRKFVDSSAFRSLAEGGIKLAEAFIRIAESLEPLLPMLLTLAGLKLGRGLAPMLGSIAGFGGRGGGGRGPVSRFARGGVVPGSGNRDTVPALLTPGEFVIRKSSVSKLGADTLHAMNENRFNKGIRVGIAGQRKDPVFSGSGSKEGIGKIESLSNQIANIPDGPNNETFGGAFLSPQGRVSDLKGQVEPGAILAELQKSKAFQVLSRAKEGTALKKEFNEIKAEANKKADFQLVSESLSQNKADKIEDIILEGVVSSVNRGSLELSKDTRINQGGTGEAVRILRQSNIDNVIGNVFEAIVANAGTPYNETTERDGANDPFDFPLGLGSVATNFGNGRLGKIATDAKTRFTSNNITSFIKKVKNSEANRLGSQILKILDRPDVLSSVNFSNRQIKGERKGVNPLSQAIAFGKGRTQNKATGGGIKGSDTIPAMLTPGEFVMNKRASQSIGYGTLNRMNKHGVQGYAAGGIVGFQNYNTGTGTLGATSAGTVNFAGINSVNEAMMRLSQTLAGMGVSVADQIPILKKFEEELKKGGKVSDALANTFKKTDINVKKTSDIIAKTNQERQKEQQAIQRSARQRGMEKIASGANRAAGVAGGVSQVAGTLQSFVFLGAAVTSLAAQFGDMEDSTKKAVTQTATLVTTIVGIGGTLLDVAATVGAQIFGAVSNFATNAAIAAQSAAVQALANNAAAASETGETLANTASGVTEAKEAVVNTASAATEATEAGVNVLSAGTEVIEAKANIAAAAAALGLTGPLIALAAAVLAVIAVIVGVAIYFTYLGFKSKAMADEMGEAADKLKEKFLETGTEIEAFISKLQSQDELNRDAGNNFETAANILLPGGLGASLTGGTEREVNTATAGTGSKTVGSIIGGMGVPGYVISQVLAYAGREAQRAVDETIDKELIGTLRERLKVEGSLIETLNEYEKELSNIDTLRLTDEEKTTRKIEAEAGLGSSGTVAASQGLVKDLDVQRKRMAELAVLSDGYNKEAAERISKLTDAELEQTLARDGGAASLGLNQKQAAILQSSLRAVSKNAQIAAKRLDDTRKNLTAASQQVDPSKSFQEAISGNTEYAQALRANIQAIKNESQIRQSQLLREADRLQAAADSTEDKKEKESYEKRAKTLRESAQQEAEARDSLIKDTYDSEQEAIDAANDRYIADQKLLAANVALRQKMLEAAQATAFFANQIKAIENIGNNLDDIASLRDGGRTQLRAKRLSEEEITPTTDLGRFEKEANEIISNISDTNAKRQAEIARDQSLAIGQFLKAVNDPNRGLAMAEGLAAGNEDGTATEGQIAQNIADRLGIDLDTLGPEIRDKIVEAVKNAGSQIDLEELEDIIDIASSGAQEYADLLKAAADAQQTYLDVYGKYLDAVQAQFDAELEYRENAFSKREGIVDSDLQARNLLAQSRDRDAVEIGPDRAAREARRQALAQSNLDAAGVGVAAGDVGGLASARDQFEKELLDLDARIKATGTGTKEATKLATEQAEAQRKLASVNKELERISDQSERRQDIINEMERNIDTVQREIESREELIEAEKKAREQMYSVLEDFVVGGTEDRQRMAQAAMGVNYAIGTGTLQNQDEEQRKATVAMLDKLSDVEITFDRATGEALTGRQVKERLVFNDAISMGFPPEVARQIAQATSKEQQLIDEVKQLNTDLVASNTDLYEELRTLNGHIDKAVDAQAPSDNFLTAAQQQVKAAEIMMDAANTMAGSSGAPPVGTGTVLAPHTGGYIGNGVLYRAGGGSIFKPKGTDTVPAMLTPGEFVIRKSAVDKIGVGTLQALNNGDGAPVSGLARGGVVYKEDGGEILKNMDPKTLELLFKDGFAKGGVVYASNGIKVPYPQAEYDKKVKDAEQRAMDSFMADQRSKPDPNLYNPDREVGNLRRPTVDESLYNPDREVGELSRGEEGFYNQILKRKARATEKFRIADQAKRDAVSRSTFEAGTDAASRHYQETGDLEAARKIARDEQSSRAQRFAAAAEKAKREGDAEKERVQNYADSVLYDASTDVSGLPIQQGLKNPDGSEYKQKSILSQKSDNQTNAFMQFTDYMLRNNTDSVPQGEIDRIASSYSHSSASDIIAEYEKARNAVQRNRLQGQKTNVQTQVGGAQDFSFGGPKKPENDDNMFDPDVIQANMEQQAAALPGGVNYSGKVNAQAQAASPLPSLDSLGLNIDPLSTDIATTRRQRQISNLKGSIARAGSGFSGEGALTKREQERIDRMKANLSKLEQQEQARSAATSGGPSPMVQGRQNVNTRRKARLAEQREGVSGGKKEKDIIELRKARGMRMRGRTADGQKYGSMAGSRLLNSMAYGSYGMGGMGGYGGGYGGGMLPFGYIPGSPYNNMLGRGGYNIPRFSPYMMFGNNARFFNSGGAAGGDTVPAMLTPGEFVMSKNAVSKYGTGLMQKLNRGKIQGYNRGGPVQYRQTGGGIMDMLGGAAQSLGIDTSKIEGVFSGFVDNFSSVFDNIISPFNGIAETLRGISESFGNFSMNHTVNVEGMVNLGGLNVEAIKSELTQHITDLVGTEIQRVNEANAKTYKT